MADVTLTVTEEEFLLLLAAFQSHFYSFHGDQSGAELAVSAASEIIHEMGETAFAQLNNKLVLRVLMTEEGQRAMSWANHFGSAPSSDNN
jgi:hypothetical protein